MQSSAPGRQLPRALLCRSNRPSRPSDSLLRPQLLITLYRRSIFCHRAHRRLLVLGAIVTCAALPYGLERRNPTLDTDGTLKKAASKRAASMRDNKRKAKAIDEGDEPSKRQRLSAYDGVDDNSTPATPPLPRGTKRRNREVDDTTESQNKRHRSDIEQNPLDSNFVQGAPDQASTENGAGFASHENGTSGNLAGEFSYLSYIYTPC